MMALTREHSATGLMSVACGLHGQHHAKPLTARYHTQEDLSPFRKRSGGSAAFSTVTKIGPPEDVVQSGIENPEPLVKAHQ
jgi:hypothetical protein